MIAPRRRMRPHLRVHGGRQQNLLVGGEQHRGREIVGDALRHLGHAVGGGRRHHHEIGLTRQTNVSDIELTRLIEQIGKRPLARDGADRERRDEFLRRTGHDDADERAALFSRRMRSRLL